ncbi:MAG: hypothetical protein J5486_07810 [Bacteroidaceae bacterium]|nr:hypothetical protein [Bacteroidaceae bacterium]
MTSDNLDEVMLNGITFRGAPKGQPRSEQERVKTKARKKAYATGAHGSGAAKKKADIRRARANRHK